jgi:hypothetical protein
VYELLLPLISRYFAFGHETSQQRPVGGLEVRILVAHRPALRRTAANMTSHLEPT